MLLNPDDDLHDPMDREILLGVPQSSYNTSRNIVGSKPSWARLVRPFDVYRLATGLWHRAGVQTTHAVAFRFCEPFFPRVDLLHFFNSLARTQTPWITTFEHRLPRWEGRDSSISESTYRGGIDLILGDACRGLVAFSDASRNVAIRDWESRLPGADARAVAAKVQVLLPPQPVIQEPVERDPERRLLFAFVGGDLYRKGGVQVLEALHRIHGRGIRRWNLVMAGNLDSYGDYASLTNAASRESVREMLGAMSDCIVHHSRLASPQVLALLQRADYYLFPTLADTFGYSALEAMACGAVVVTTNVRAMPEVIDDQVGHLIRLPLDDDRDAHSLPDFERAKADLSDELEFLIGKLLETSDEDRLRRAIAATGRLRTRHDPKAHAAAIDRLYRRALGLTSTSTMRSA